MQKTRENASATIKYAMSEVMQIQFFETQNYPFSACISDTGGAAGLFLGLNAIGKLPLYVSLRHLCHKIFLVKSSVIFRYHRCYSKGIFVPEKEDKGVPSKRHRHNRKHSVLGCFMRWKKILTSDLHEIALLLLVEDQNPISWNTLLCANKIFKLNQCIRISFLIIQWQIV